MSKKPNTFIAPSHVQMLFAEVAQADRMAQFYANAAANAEARAWIAIRELHPASMDTILSYNHINHEITVAPKGVESKLRSKEPRSKEQT